MRKVCSPRVGSTGDNARAVRKELSLCWNARIITTLVREPTRDVASGTPVVKGALYGLSKIFGRCARSDYPAYEVAS